MKKNAIVGSVLLIALGLVASPAMAQPKSPRGKSATQTGVGYSKWVTVDYSRPILRGRQGILGEGESYGQKVNAGAPVWRAGADMSTRLNSEVDLKFGETTLPAGEYSLFVELKSPDQWNLIVSNHKAQERYNPNDKEAIWGAYGYDVANDVLRVPMQVAPLADGLSIDQLTWLFGNVSETGGSLTLVWDNSVGTAAFSVAE